MWDDADIRAYEEQGYLLRRGLLGRHEVDQLNAQMEGLLGEDQEDGIHRERERTGAVRQVYLAHRHSAPFRQLVRDPRLVAPVRQILGGDIYVWHSKINVKAPFEGTVWLWHQDYGYWVHDGVEARLMSAMVFLDQATLNNGCLLVAEGSHRMGLLPHVSDEVTTSYRQWCIPSTQLQGRLREEQIRAITGDAGDVLFFNDRLLHASGHNLSPLPRKTVIFCYNDLRNTPRQVAQPRPDWVVSRQFDAVT